MSTLGQHDPLAAVAAAGQTAGPVQSGRSNGGVDSIGPGWVPSRTLTEKLVMEFRCPACGHRLRTPRKHSGKIGRCPVCSTVFSIPHRPRWMRLHW